MAAGNVLRVRPRTMRGRSSRWAAPAVALLVAATAACGSTSRLGTTEAAQGPQRSGSTTTRGVLSDEPGPGGSASTPESSAAAGTAQGPASAGAPPPPAVAEAGPAPAAAGGRIPSRHPGASDRELTFGFLALMGTEQYGGGVGGDLSSGDPRRQVEAVVEAINAGGGIAGRQVRLIVHPFRAGESIDRQLQEACERFTEDNQVFAVSGNVVGITSGVGEVLQECIGRNGAIYIENQAAGDSTSLNRFPGGAYAPGTALADRSGALMVDALVKARWFERGAVIGMHAIDTPVWRRVYEKSVVPRLAAHGLKVTEEAFMPVGDTGAEGVAEYPSVTLRFKRAGVTHILTLGAIPAFFAQAAESQGFRPKWAFDSETSPVNWAGLMPEAQRAGSLGIGWAPSRDVLAAQRGEPVNEAEQRCVGIMQGAGEDPKPTVARQLQLSACEPLFFLEAALASAPEISQRGFAAGVATLGTGYLSPVTWKTAFTPGRLDGLAAYRLVAFGKACGCLTYVSDRQAVD